MRIFRFLLAALTALCFAAASQAAPVQGQDYTLLSLAQPTEPGKKVEVIEFFAYYCPHCNALDPDLSTWVKSHADKIVFKRVHVSANGEPMAQQRLFYALEAMGNVESFHAKIFHAMHVEHDRVNTDDDAINLAVKLGLDRAKFTSYYNSFAVQTKVQRAIQMMQSYQISSWPTIVIDGKYVTSPSVVGAHMGGGYEEHGAGLLLLKVMDELVDQQLKTRH
ncbi:MAG: thiol:disulfide interchange protein DsbA/DsbL [Burkholderiaceae bacterium]|nr:thiol:disulfide interchange protein DsbA/DsbL [Burkholderiaceae bacterium]